MNEQHHSIISPKEFARILTARWKLWLVPALIIGAITTIYAFARRDTWEASQALIVRNEAANNDRGPGKFNQPDEMKTVQETILEIARGRSVLESALKQVGPPSGKTPETWPTARDIDILRDAVKILPPKGAEFGKTEVFYLTVRDNNRDRSIALNSAIYDHLKTRFQELRDTKARSMVEELSKTAALAKADLTQSTKQLSAIESEIGGDLAELRAMQDVGAGDSALRRNTEEIRNQLRETAATAKANQELLVVLHEAQNDPGLLVAAPNKLLESQPSLKRLKDGLIDAQLQTAQLLGARSAEHPLVKAARASEEEIGNHLHSELALAIRGMEIEQRLTADRQKILENQLAAASKRLGHLADIRASYETQAAENRNRTALAERAEQNLAEARAVLAGAKVASLISTIDAPDTGSKPVGPGRTIIALCGIIAGLITGLGIVFLSLPTNTPISAPVTEIEITETNHARHFPAYETVVDVNEHNGHGAFTLKKALEKIHINGIF
jgi:polysaccharide biosynthesis transport protein